MDRVKALIREPALLIDAFESLVVFAVALGFLGLSGDQQTNTIALFIAVLALAKGFLTQPFPVTVIPDLGRAALVFCVSLGMLNLSADQITVTVTMLGTVIAALARGQITPRFDPVVRTGGAGAGPLSGTPTERGAANALFIAGVVVLVLGVLAIILLAAGQPLVSLVWCILLIVAGAVLMYLGSRHTGARL
jgi:hypothetical protein